MIFNHEKSTKLWKLIDVNLVNAQRKEYGPIQPIQI